MTDEDPAVERYLALAPQEYILVDRLELRRMPPGSEWGPGLSLELELIDGDLDVLRSAFNLWLKFYRIAGLKLDVGSALGVSQLEIHSIRDRGWEHLHYVIEDTESGDTFKFYCDWFEAELRPRSDSS